MIISFFLPVQAADYHVPAFVDKDIINDLVISIQNVHQRYSAENFSESKKRACSEGYSKLFSRDEIRIGLFYGYGDISDDYPYTSDIAERKWLETELTKRCQYDQIELCGFRRHPEDKDAYYKKINVQNQIKTILIYFKQASLTDDVELNTVKRKQTQIAHSRKVQKAYLNSLKKDDINIYFGHARFGSGPGFLPIKNFSTTWTKTYLLRPFLSEMKSVFESAKQKPKLIGMINCDGQEHYGRFLSKYAPDSALFLTRQTMSADDALRTMYVGLNSLLTQTCEDEFKEQMLSTITTVFYDKTEGKPKDISEKTPTLFNFFKKEKVDGDFYWLWMLKYFLGEEKEIPVSDIH